MHNCVSRFEGTLIISKCLLRVSRIKPSRTCVCLGGYVCRHSAEHFALSVRRNHKHEGGGYAHAPRVEKLTVQLGTNHASKPTRSFFYLVTQFNYKLLAERFFVTFNTDGGGLFVLSFGGALCLVRRETQSKQKRGGHKVNIHPL